MLCRLHTRILSTAATLFLLASAASVQASSTSSVPTTLLNYKLSNQGPSTVSRIDFNVLSPGSVVPPVVATDPTTGANVTGSPLTLLPNSTGFDPNYFSVALGNKPGAQILRLLFGQAQTVDANGNVTFSSILDSNGNPIGGFQPGGNLNFAVSVDPTTRDQFRLQIASNTPGLTLNQLPVSDTVVASTTTPTSGAGTTTTTTPPHQVPEPMSVLVWGGLVGLGLTRARLFRKSATV